MSQEKVLPKGEASVTSSPDPESAEVCRFESQVPRAETPMTEVDSDSYMSSSKLDFVETANDLTPSTVPLTKLPLFQPRLSITREEAFEISYQRAQVLNRHYSEYRLCAIFSNKSDADSLKGLTIEDIINLTPRFFDMHRDDIIIRDIGSHALLSIQHNLAAGTLAPYAKESPQVEQLLERVLKFEVS